MWPLKSVRLSAPIGTLVFRHLQYQISKTFWCYFRLKPTNSFIDSLESINAIDWEPFNFMAGCKTIIKKLDKQINWLFENTVRPKNACLPMSIKEGFGVKQLQLICLIKLTLFNVPKIHLFVFSSNHYFVIKGGKKGLAGGGRTQKSGEIASLLRHLQQLDENAIGESCSWIVNSLHLLSNYSPPPHSPPYTNHLFQCLIDCPNNGEIIPGIFHQDLEND